MRICIDARIPDARSGGVQQLIIGLASGLAGLSDGDEEYVFVTFEGREDWLRPVIGGRCRIQTVAMPLNRISKLRGRLGKFPLLAESLRIAYHALRTAFTIGLDIKPTPSTGIFERLGADVVHFPLQAAEMVSLPNIYHPHDLQHIHYPLYFTALERRSRQFLYSAYSRNASVIAVASSWVKQDLIDNLHCPSDKIHVVPLAPPNTTAVYRGGPVKALFLPPRFFFYPAQLWPHKNHVLLIEALAHLHNLDNDPPHLVFTGNGGSHKRKLEKRISRLGLTPYVHFLGHVAPNDLNAIYRSCIACVIPSLFEAGSFPAWEAFFAGAPVAAASITSLPAQIGDAGILFDPHDARGLARVLTLLCSDQSLRKALIAKGHLRVSRTSWARTALHFRALYRKIGKKNLTIEDKFILSKAPSL